MFLRAERAKTNPPTERVLIDHELLAILATRESRHPSPGRLV